MDSLFIRLGVLIAAIVLILVGVIVLLRLFRKVEQGHVLIVSKIKRVHVRSPARSCCPSCTRPR